MKALVIAGVASGVGKTTVATGLMGALVARGLRVQGFKVGPDYIDPAFHTAVTGRPSRNLDSWLLPPSVLRGLFARAAASADAAIVEGVMGLYDGRHGGGDEASTGQVARLLDLPVVLVVDASRQGRSAAATVMGFRAFDPALRLIGVILNRVASASHQATLTEAIESHTGLPVLGAIHRDAGLTVPERYLGLVPPFERSPSDEYFSRAAGIIAREVDLARLLQLAEVPPPPVDWRLPWPSPRAPRAALAVARDRAFGFYYADAIDSLAALGLEIREFSPLSDATLPPDVDGVYLGGGFPEMFGGELAANVPLLRELRAAARRGLPVYAECGGLMYLARGLTDKEGQRHQMAGVVPAEVTLQEPRLSLGYREVAAARDSLLLRAGDVVRGHEFHYSRCAFAAGTPAAYSVAGREPAREGCARGQVLASYVHVHLAGAPASARRLVDAYAAWRARRAA